MDCCFCINLHYIFHCSMSFVEIKVEEGLFQQQNFKVLLVGTLKLQGTLISAFWVSLSPKKKLTLVWTLTWWYYTHIWNNNMDLHLNCLSRQLLQMTLSFSHSISMWVVQPVIKQKLLFTCCYPVERHATTAWLEQGTIILSFIL